MTRQAHEDEDRFLQDLAWNLENARAKHQTPIHNAHEGYGVMAEEFHEFFLEVCKQRHEPHAMYKELLHVAAMAMRTALDVVYPQLEHEEASR